jgi:hypothetical protein
MSASETLGALSRALRLGRGIEFAVMTEPDRSDDAGRGIVIGVGLGAVAWLALIGFGLLAWRLLS